MGLSQNRRGEPPLLASEGRRLAGAPGPVFWGFSSVAAHGADSQAPLWRVFNVLPQPLTLSFTAHPPRRDHVGKRALPRPLLSRPTPCFLCRDGVSSLD